MNTTPHAIDWVEHFGKEEIQISKLSRDEPSRLYIETSTDHSTVEWEVSVYQYNIYLDKLVTNGEEVRLYFHQLLDQLTERLNFVKYSNLTPEFFGSQEFTDKALLLTDAIAMVIKVMGPNNALWYGNYGKTRAQSIDDYWLSRYQGLMFHPSFVYTMEQMTGYFPTNLMFWR